MQNAAMIPEIESESLVRVAHPHSTPVSIQSHRNSLSFKDICQDQIRFLGDVNQPDLTSDLADVNECLTDKSKASVLRQRQALPVHMADLGAVSMLNVDESGWTGKSGDLHSDRPFADLQAASSHELFRANCPASDVPPCSSARLHSA